MREFIETESSERVQRQEKTSVSAEIVRWGEGRERENKESKQVNSPFFYVLFYSNP